MENRYHFISKQLSRLLFNIFCQGEENYWAERQRVQHGVQAVKERGNVDNFTTPFTSKKFRLGPAEVQRPERLSGH